jgi:hypothetical protein
VPYYTFVDNAVPTSSELNSNLRDQVTTQCTLATRPGNPAEGQYIFQTDNDRRYVWTGSAWRLVGGTGLVAFTPSWTNLTVGNATESWSYAYTEGGMIVTGKLTFGTTTTVTGTVQMTVPNSVVASVYGAGSLHMLDAGSRHWVGTVYVDSGSSTINFVHTETGNAGLVNATSPHTWASTDTIGFTLLVPFNG